MPTQTWGQHTDIPRHYVHNINATTTDINFSTQQHYNQLDTNDLTTYILIINSWTDKSTTTTTRCNYYCTEYINITVSNN